ncbi:MAG: type I methionyl aminopeptidase [Elusimicrobia bacterium]|nr:type I methionyl aminopeptidase [Elusimicrobiota bacterium]MBP9127469.1 type I methionyl aminopeptidase [Elusimicrobiota bacterium]MBP9698567.1 type I methionyl aminopeptidase [Elusimicrobiota bacterium]
MGARKIELKSPADLDRMRRAGRLAATALRAVGRAVAPGVTTKELDRLAEKLIRDGGGIPTFLGYRGFTASICASINDEVVHGIPTVKRVLRPGDIVGIDIGATLGGFVGDTAATFPVGPISDEAQRLLKTTQESLNQGIAAMRVGNRLGDVSCAIQKTAEEQGYSVVRDFVGHGIGREMHEEPSVPNYGSAGTGVRLEPGLVLALEPMVNAGTWRVQLLKDGWTVVTEDGRWSAHFEHTVALTENGPEVLTVPDEERSGVH